jgi:hypothetical protein
LVEINRNGTPLPFMGMHGAMKTEVSVGGEWSEADRSKRVCRFAGLRRRYKKVGVDITSELACIVQPAGNGWSPKQNAVNPRNCKCADDFGCCRVDQECLCSAYAVPVAHADNISEAGDASAEEYWYLYDTKWFFPLYLFALSAAPAM